MDLNVMQKQLMDGLRQLELRVAAQEGALALLDKLMQPETEDVEPEEVPKPMPMGEIIPEGVVTPEMIEEVDDG